MCEWSILSIVINGAIVVEDLTAIVHAIVKVENVNVLNVVITIIRDHLVLEHEQLRLIRITWWPE